MSATTMWEGAGEAVPPADFCCRAPRADDGVRLHAYAKLVADADLMKHAALHCTEGNPDAAADAGAAAAGGEEPVRLLYERVAYGAGGEERIASFVADALVARGADRATVTLRVGSGEGR